MGPKAPPIDQIRVMGVGLRKEFIWQPDRDHRTSEFLSVESAYKGHSDQALSGRVKDQGEKIVALDAIQQGQQVQDQQVKVSWQVMVDRRITNQEGGGGGPAADRSTWAILESHCRINGSQAKRSC